MPNNSGSKVSPRKFSEKIALLIKKEAEGNAKFEEIIKEVQATRIHTATPRHSTTYRSRKVRSQDTKTKLVTTSSDEIEEVYEDIIKFVDDYERALNNPHSNCGLGGANATSLQTVRPESVCDRSIPTADNLCKTQSNSPPCSHPDQSTSLTNLNDSLNLYYSGFPCKQDHHPPYIDTTSHGALSCPTTNDNASHRSRVTSVGSVYHRRSNPSEESSKQPGQELVSGQGQSLFLIPYSNEKNWQKSCSDPALNAASISAHHDQVIDSSFHLTNQINCSTSAHVNLSDTCITHIINPNGIKEQAQVKTSNSTQFQQKESYIDDIEYPCVQQAPVVQEMPEDSVDKDSHAFDACRFASITYKLDSTIGSDQAMCRVAQVYENSQTLLSLPGIKICPFDDCERLKLDLNDVNDARIAARNRSLPDIQYNAGVQHNQTEVQVHGTKDEHVSFCDIASMQSSCIGSMNTTLEHEPETMLPLIQASCACANYQLQVKEPSCTNTGLNIEADMDSELTRSLMFDSSQQANGEHNSNGSLSVTSSMIGGQYGLVHPETKNTGLIHNIMRSHSHGGIDELTRKVSSRELCDIRSDLQQDVVIAACGTPDPLRSRSSDPFHETNHSSNLNYTTMDYSPIGLSLNNQNLTYTPEGRDILPKVAIGNPQV